MKNIVLSTTRLETLHANVSDHIPGCCTFNYSFQQFLESSEKPALQSKLKLDKIDKTRYQTIVTTKLMEVRNAGPCALDIHVRQINDALVKAAEEVRSKTVKRHRKARLNMWTQEIKEALSSKQKTFWEWKQNNRPNHEGNVFVTNKKLTTRYLRKLCRMESSNIKGAARQQILDARSSDTKMFHKLIDKQRGKVNFCVSELHVGESTFSTSSGILQGWREHFSKLATP